MKRAPVWAAAIVLAAGACGVSRAEEGQGDHSSGRGGPVYQRHAYSSSPMRGGPHGDQHSQFAAYNAPQINSGWFQRPYPYHLDYYRMRYGGSYAPYFGNLYGSPQVVTAPPYYGPYYGGYGFQGDAFQGANGAGQFGCPCDPNWQANGSGAGAAAQTGPPLKSTSANDLAQ